VKILLLATGFVAQYRVLRCAAAVGQVFVAGPANARSLALSRYCKRFLPFALQDRDSAEAAVELDRLARELHADLIMPSDLQTTELLARISSHLTTPAFPVPNVAALEHLATKDRFMAYCRARNLPHPQGRIFASKGELLTALNAGKIRFPAILKPIDRAGSMGVVRLDRDHAIADVSAFRYAPLLVQDFVVGEDRSMTVFCRDGVIEKQVVYSHPDDVFRFIEDTAFGEIVADIARDLRLNGVINFDARIEPSGRIWLIECNPRFYFNMDVAMVLGANFADLSAPVASLAGTTVRLPRALLRDLKHGRLPAWPDLKMLWHWLRDPLMFALVMTGYHRRWHSPRLEQVLGAHKCAA
jgi:biotin carboxylase